MQLFDFDFQSYFREKNPDEQRKQAREKQRASHVLPWIANPFRETLAVQIINKQHQQHEQNNVPGSVPRTDSAIMAKVEATAHDVVERDEALERQKQGELPIQLLYDLFFVANLSAITSDKEFYNSDTLITYVLFFAILWFTWLQVTFHDLRYSRDSFYERICKAIQFATMVIFAARSRAWDPFELGKEDSIAAIQYVTMTLMATRLFLTLQYCVVVYFRWRTNRDPKAPDEPLAPVIAHVVIMGCATLMYLILYIAFKTNTDSVKYWWIWFVVLPVETLAIILASCNWISVDFEDGVLVKRMGTLTLIVLGEGIIVLIKSVETVTNSETAWHVSLGVTIISALIITYLLWMFYFDYMPGNHVMETSLQQHIWAALHFPLHVALVVFAEAMRQFIVLWSYADHFYELSSSVPVVPRVQDNGEMTFDPVTQDSIDHLRRWFEMLYESNMAPTVQSFHQHDLDLLNNWNASMHGVNLTTATDSELNEMHRKTIGPVFWDVLAGFLELFQLRTPDKAIYERPSPDQAVAKAHPDHIFHGVWVPPIFEEAMVVIFFVFRALVVAMGVVFLLYAILAFLVRGRHDPYDAVAIGIRLLVAVIFFSFMSITGTFSSPQEASLQKLQSRAGKLIDSEFLGVVLATIMFGALLIGKFGDYWAYRRARDNSPRDEGEKGEGESAAGLDDFSFAEATGYSAIENRT